MTIAEANPDATFHYLEADRRLDPVFEMFGTWQGDNVLRYPGFEYDQMLQSCKDILDNVKTVTDPWNQWVIIDTIGHCYREISNTYTLRHYGMLADALKEKRANANNTGWQQGYGFDGFSGTEWAFIKRIFYNEFIWPMVRYAGNNIILIAHAREASGRFTPQAPTEYTDRFNKLGQFPDVHKDVIRYLDTVLYFSNVNDFTFQTLKETGKRKWVDEPRKFDNFWKEYQRAIA